MSNVQVWSCGGGVQSAAIGALIVQGRLPRPDLAVIADTERERSSTWAYFDSVLKPELARVGVDIVRVRKSDYGAPDIWQGADGNTISMPVFFTQQVDINEPDDEDEDDDSLLLFAEPRTPREPQLVTKISRAPGYCSNEWKGRVVDRWLRAQGVKKSEAVIWLGISLDEIRRVRAGNYRYPLINDVPMRRTGCLHLIGSMGWPEAPKSSCWMCPNRRNVEWVDMRDNWPEDWTKAVKMDYELRERDPNVFLHDSGLPLDLALIDVEASGVMSLSDQCAGMCWV